MMRRKLKPFAFERHLLSLLIVLLGLSGWASPVRVEADSLVCGGTESTFANAPREPGDADWGSLTGEPETCRCLSAVSHTTYLHWTGLKCAVPLGASIDGILVSLRRTQSDISTNFIRDYKIGLIVGGIRQQDRCPQNLNSCGQLIGGPRDFVSFTDSTYGNALDLWGVPSLSRSDIVVNFSAFGLYYSAYRNQTGNLTLTNNWVQLTQSRSTIIVYYSSPITIATPATTATAASTASTATTATTAVAYATTALAASSDVSPKLPQLISIGSGSADTPIELLVTIAIILLLLLGAAAWIFAQKRRQENAADSASLTSDSAARVDRTDAPLTNTPMSHAIKTSENLTPYSSMPSEGKDGAVSRRASPVLLPPAFDATHYATIPL